MTSRQPGLGLGSIALVGSLGGSIACGTEAPDPFSDGASTVLDDTASGEPCGPCSSGRLDASSNCVGALATRVDDLLANAGALQASTVFDDDVDQFGPELARDGDRSTSWFSAGPDGGISTLEWTTPRADCIVGVRMLNNTQHADEDFRLAFGFEGARFRLFRDGSTTPLWEGVAALQAIPDPDVDLEVIDEDGALGVVADRLEVVLSGHEDPTCGGISELEVSAYFE